MQQHNFTRPAPTNTATIFTPAIRSESGFVGVSVDLLTQAEEQVISEGTWITGNLKLILGLQHSAFVVHLSIPRGFKHIVIRARERFLPVIPDTMWL